MSNTSQCFQHYYESQQLDAQPGKWALRLPALIRADFAVPQHIEILSAAPVELRCHECGDSRTCPSPNAVGGFVDQHRHSGDRWECSDCGAPEFTARTHCRVCEAPRPEHPVQTSADPLAFRARYEIARVGYHPSEVVCNSLREALRAARAMFPHEQVTVHLGARRWEVMHRAK